MIHVAGPMVDGVQRCTRCEAILLDYRNAMMPVGSGRVSAGWKLGALVAVKGNWSGVTDETDRPMCRRRITNG